MSNSETFVIDLIGDVSGIPWKGKFKTKLRLSHREQLKQDEIRRDLLGKNAENPSPRAQNAADVFSFVLVHIVEAPQWWTAADNGLELEDDNVVGEVYGEIVKARIAAQQKLKEDADKAKGELAKIDK